MLIGHVHINAGIYNNGIALFSLISRGLPFIEVMAGLEYTVQEMTVAYLNEIVLVWAGIAHGFRTNLVVIEGNLNAQRYRDEIRARHVIPLFQNNAKNNTFFQHDNATSHTARDTVNFPRANNIAFYL